MCGARLYCGRRLGVGGEREQPPLLPGSAHCSPTTRSLVVGASVCGGGCIRIEVRRRRAGCCVLPPHLPPQGPAPVGGVLHEHGAEELQQRVKARGTYWQVAAAVAAVAVGPRFHRREQPVVELRRLLRPHLLYPRRRVFEPRQCAARLRLHVLQHAHQIRGVERDVAAQRASPGRRLEEGVFVPLWHLALDHVRKVGHSEVRVRVRGGCRERFRPHGGEVSGAQSVRSDGRGGCVRRRHCARCSAQQPGKSEVRTPK
mmetsp:Transcript_14532/g.35520  ORF Transcript_14532/g.35520 Transcript_14532/m.35520 type:complete len:258 (+) Transcript_14532:262-1035(+)